LATWDGRWFARFQGVRTKVPICIQKETDMQRFMRLAVGVAVLTACGLSIPGAGAQSSSEPPASQSSADIPDNKLDAAAVAMRRIASLQQDYRDQIASAPSADRGRIANEASNALTKAVTDQGLSVDEYAKIVDAAQNDLDVRQRILQRLRSLRDETGESHQ
jgi:Domain of unknown function (DUF4168)